MADNKLNWQPDLSLATGKGASVQRFIAITEIDELEIDTVPWGEADLKINGRTIAHIVDQPTAGEAFRNLEAVAEIIEANKDAAKAGKA